MARKYKNSDHRSRPKIDGKIVAEFLAIEEIGICAAARAVGLKRPRLVEILKGKKFLYLDLWRKIVLHAMEKAIRGGMKSPEALALYYRFYR